MRNKVRGRDEQLIDNLNKKYGYSIDMSIVYMPYEKINLDDVRRVLSSILRHGQITIERDCDVEEFVAKSYSNFLRRYGRVDRKLIVSQYGHMYADTLMNSHKAILADNPTKVNVDNQKILVELQGGYVDYDQYSDPRYIMVQKVKLTDKHTAVKVVFNSMLHKFTWSEFININLLLGGALSYFYKCDVLFGRATSISARSEKTAMFSSGKQRGDIVSAKGALQEELELMGLGINPVMDKMDIEIAALYASREVRAVASAIEGLCQKASAGDSYQALIRYLETVTIPLSRESKSVPKFDTIYDFAKKFIKAETKSKDLDPTMLNEICLNLAALISAYISQVSLLTHDPQAECSFLILGLPRSTDQLSA